MFAAACGGELRHHSRQVKRGGSGLWISQPRTGDRAAVPRLSPPHRHGGRRPDSLTLSQSLRDASAFSCRFCRPSRPRCGEAGRAPCALTDRKRRERIRRQRLNAMQLILPSDAAAIRPPTLGAGATDPPSGRAASVLRMFKKPSGGPWRRCATDSLLRGSGTRPSPAATRQRLQSIGYAAQRHAPDDIEATGQEGPSWAISDETAAGACPAHYLDTNTVAPRDGDITGQTVNSAGGIIKKTKGRAILACEATALVAPTAKF